MIRFNLISLLMQPLMIKKACVLMLPIFVLCACQTKELTTLLVTETAGIGRDLEYITVALNAGEISPVSLREAEKESGLIAGQLLKAKKDSSGKFLLEYIFPVTVGAHESKKFEIVFLEGDPPQEGLITHGTGLELKLENTHFIADLTSTKATAENGLEPGQVAGLVLKQFNNQLLERSHIDMHWAPSFRKEGLSYKTLGHVRPDSVFVNSEGPYLSTIFRKGNVKQYEEICVTGTYQFFAGLPYFTFSSEMLMEDDVALTLLRNDEMTMDSLFTHLMFPGDNGEIREIELYASNTIEDLDRDRIPDDVNWLCFYHTDLKYALGSIRIAYDNTNMNGGQSPTFQKHTKISAGVNGGRYWNRRLIHEEKTLVPKGSRYIEKNAYLVFAVNSKDPSAQIRDYFQRISNPLKVTLFGLQH
ncbi:hypothetical protein QQ020_06755 [Fulvivirgaceae bacterium BMA12]|uniref:Lipoprotein n=1 Tax=Agaribacillus aureus TaxID=3051825 RepID=A0ABT8L3B9_9BACT|nr:hypothetical protein [Fulvivirgaceae bacterium BMA12]